MTQHHKERLFRLLEEKIVLLDSVYIQSFKREGTQKRMLIMQVLRLSFVVTPVKANSSIVLTIDLIEDDGLSFVAMSGHRGITSIER